MEEDSTGTNGNVNTAVVCTSMVKLTEAQSRDDIADETKPSKDEGAGGRALVERYQRWLQYEVVGLGVLIVIVWALLTLPIIFFYLPLKVDDMNMPGETLNKTNGTNETLNGTMMEIESGSVMPTLLNCQEDFFRDPEFFNSCVPTCPDWKQDPDSISIFIDVVVFLSYTSGFVIAITILIISFIRRNTMLTFPNAMVVYITLVYTLQNFFYIVTYFDRSGLYCSSKNLYKTFVEVTPYCIITGMVSVYSTLSVAIWWFFLTAAVFWKIWFPFHARSFKMANQLKYIHTICGIAGFFIPFAPMIALMSAYSKAVKTQDPPTTFVKGGMGFASVRSPPFPCNGNDKTVLFYSVIMPSDIILATGITLIILIFWLVHKQHGIFKANQFKNPFKIGVHERKLLIIFCYYVVATVINLTAFSDFARKSEIFEHEIGTYFMCELKGHNSSDPCVFNNPISTTLVILSYGFHGILPIVNLIFAVNVQDLKAKCKLRTKVGSKADSGIRKSGTIITTTDDI